MLTGIFILMLVGAIFALLDGAWLPFLLLTSSAAMLAIASRFMPV